MGKNEETEKKEYQELMRSMRNDPKSLIEYLKTNPDPNIKIDEKGNIFLRYYELVKDPFKISRLSYYKKLKLSIGIVNQIVLALEVGKTEKVFNKFDFDMKYQGIYGFLSSHGIRLKHDTESNSVTSLISLNEAYDALHELEKKKREVQSSRIEWFSLILSILAFGVSIVAIIKQIG